MKKNAAAADERQLSIPVELPPGPPISNDRRALEEVRHIVSQLEEAKSHPWSARLLGWQTRKVALLSEKLTPLEAASWRARLDAALERLGPAED